ncbi:MAG: hypothetical protein AAF713_22480 [Pseudomonadota bacterium]
MPDFDNTWNPAQGTPYLHWFETQELGKYREFTGSIVDFPAVPFAGDLGRSPQDTVGGLSAPAQSPLFPPARIPIPGDVKNDNDVSDWTPPLDKLGNVPANAVIVGIVDEGIGVANARFRHPVGTRVLSAWQQGSTFAAQWHLPFGREIYRDEIDAGLAKLARGEVDEPGLYRQWGMIELDKPLGMRTLSRRMSHGTHVLDVLTGENPETLTKDEAMRRPIIAVNLPARQTVGGSGMFLEYFMMMGVARIVHIADKLWDHLHSGAHLGQPQGFPIAINISYGQQAGPKDGSGIFYAWLRDLVGAREDSGRPPLRLTFSAGNDNLSRANALCPLGPKAEGALTWRIQPGDQSSNFAEVWTEPVEITLPDDKCPLALEDDLGATTLRKIARRLAGLYPSPLAISVEPPGQTVDPKEGIHARHMDIEPAARVGDAVMRIYCQYVIVDDQGEVIYSLSQGQENVRSGTARLRYRFLICVPPTENVEKQGATVPPGPWRIRLRNLTDRPVLAQCGVQVDYELEPGSVAERRSYFDGAGYFEPAAGTSPRRAGLRRDSYAYPVGDPFDPADGLQERNPPASPVQRRGTSNSLVTARDPLTNVIVAGAYRKTDGWPAGTSSTAVYPPTRGAGGAPRPGSVTAAFVTEDGPGHFGVLGSGSLSGSVTAMTGTSFAAAEAGRCVIAQLLEWERAKPDDSLGDIRAISFAALAHEAGQGGLWRGRAHGMKAGAGRLPQMAQSARRARKG